MRAPLGTFVHARSGDKGGDANVGLWVRQGEKRDERVAWLLGLVTPAWVRELLPEAASLEVAALAEAGPTCLLCFERDPERCHRRVLSERLAGMGFEIVDLFA